MAIPSWKIIPALVCGNTVVFQPRRLTPLSAVISSELPKKPASRPASSILLPAAERVGEATLAITTCVLCRSPVRLKSGQVAEQPRHHSNKIHSKWAAKSHNRHGRRQPRPRSRRLAVGWFRNHRSTLHGFSRIIVHHKVYKTFPENSSKRRNPCGSEMNAPKEIGPR